MVSAVATANKNENRDLVLFKVVLNFTSMLNFIPSKLNTVTNFVN